MHRVLTCLIFEPIKARISLAISEAVYTAPHKSTSPPHLLRNAHQAPQFTKCIQTQLAHSSLGIQCYVPQIFPSAYEKKTLGMWDTASSAEQGVLGATATHDARPASRLSHCPSCVA